MARSLDNYDLTKLTRSERLLDPRRLDRSAARAIAAAISSLLITTLVVSSSVSALEPEGTVAGNSFGAGTITLVDDDRGRSLVNLSDMAPGRPVTECITIEYTGSILPVDLSLGATADGSLAEFLTLDGELGTGGEFGDCDGFEPLTTVFSGTLNQLVTADSLKVTTFKNSGDKATFRFRFELLDDGRAVGAATAADFVWEVVPQ